MAAMPSGEQPSFKSRSLEASLLLTRRCASGILAYVTEGAWCARTGQIVGAERPRGRVAWALPATTRTSVSDTTRAHR